MLSPDDSYLFFLWNNFYMMEHVFLDTGFNDLSDASFYNELKRLQVVTRGENT
jgi:hypothetical protein